MDNAIITLVIMAATAVLLAGEFLPLSITALLSSLALIVTGVLPASRVFQQFASPNVMLFASMFVIGHAVTASGLGNDIGRFIARFSGSEKKLVLVLLLVAGAFAALLSKTSAFAIFFPLVTGVATGTGFNRGRLLYTLVVAVGMGGCVTFLGGPSWLFTKSQIEAAYPGTTAGMFEITKVTLVLYAISVLYMMLVGYRLLPARTPREERAGAAARTEMPGARKKLVAATCLATILGIMLSNRLGTDAAVIAVLGATALVLTGAVGEKEAFRSINWPTLVLFAGILPLSAALGETGAGALIARTFFRLMGRTHNPFLITAVCLAVPCVVTQFISNTACMAIFTPLGVSIAGGMGVNPLPVIMAISIGSGMAISTPVGQPGNAMIYGPSGLRFTDYTRAGLPLTLILLAVATVMIPFVWPLY